MASDLDSDEVRAEIGRRVATMMRQADPALRPQELMRFALDIDDLNVAVDMLVFFRVKQTWSALLSEFIYERALKHAHGVGCEPRVGLGKVMDVVQFLTSQGLLVRLKPLRRKDGHSESVLKAIPRAVDELIHRIVNNGEPSTPPQPQPSFEEQRQQARDEVSEALLAAGYHSTDKGTGKGRRLRVVR